MQPVELWTDQQSDSSDSRVIWMLMCRTRLVDMCAHLDIYTHKDFPGGTNEKGNVQSFRQRQVHMQYFRGMQRSN